MNLGYNFFNKKFGGTFLITEQKTSLYESSWLQNIIPIKNLFESSDIFLTSAERSMDRIDSKV